MAPSSHSNLPANGTAQQFTDSQRIRKRHLTYVQRHERVTDMAELRCGKICQAAPSGSLGNVDHEVDEAVCQGMNRQRLGGTSQKSTQGLVGELGHHEQ